jgi:hypothetical protein
VFKEILKIIPRIDNNDLSKMERSLTRRFGNVARKLGRGVINAFAGGAAIAAVAKLLNPLKEVREAIEQTLTKSDDLATFAKQFGTSAGKLDKLVAYGDATGLDREALFQLLTKFQTTVAEAGADPTKQTSVRNFAGRTDTADAFFEFIQGLQKLDSAQQTLVQQEVFGEKQILKMSDFLQSDFAKLNAQYFSDIDSGKQTAALEKLASLKDQQDALRARRNLLDIQTKAGIINEGTIRGLDKSDAQKLAKENDRISRFKSLNDLDLKLEKMSADLEKLVTELPVVMSAVGVAVDALKKSVEGWGLIIKTMKESSFFKRLFRIGK